MKVTLRIWRQKNTESQGRMESYELDGISDHMSFLEMLDLLNEQLTIEGQEPVAFDSDCREGICGQCGVVINGVAHGRGETDYETTTCQLHMREFADGDIIDIEPWQADPFPVIKDLVVDRGAFDRIIQAGGYVSAPTGTAPDAHAVPVPTTVTVTGTGGETATAGHLVVRAGAFSRSTVVLHFRGSATLVENVEVVVGDGAAVDPDDLMAWVAERVSPHKRIRQVRFIDAVPKSASGKILRKDLPVG